MTLKMFVLTIHSTHFLILVIHHIYIFVDSQEGLIKHTLLDGVAAVTYSITDCKALNEGHTTCDPISTKAE